MTDFARGVKCGSREAALGYLARFRPTHLPAAALQKAARRPDVENRAGLYAHIHRDSFSDTLIDKIRISKSEIRNKFEYQK